MSVTDRFLNKSLSPIRRGSMRIGPFARQTFNKGNTAQLFNLDLHISVVADIAEGLRELNTDLYRWSISGHNYLTRKLFKFPDPVGIVNQKSWMGLDENLIDRFQDRYGAFLRRFDGFVVTYPPAFAELYRGFDRPILVVAATRYEAPYSSQPSQWKRLNSFLASQEETGRLCLVANNRGDRDYMTYYSGLFPEYVPSVCDYTGATWRGLSGKKVILSRAAALTDELVSHSRGVWQPTRSILPRPYSWQQLADAQEVFFIPYNVSTMTLFELATSGVPVSVPSRKLMKILWERDLGLLGEVSWFQVREIGRPPAGDALNNTKSSDFLNFWLGRADFYDAALMPNVRQVDSFEQLCEEPHPVTQMPSSRWHNVVRTRNEILKERRRSLLTKFTQML